MKQKCVGLCYYCNHRRQWLEEGHAPRHECQDPTSAISSCYCYRPLPLLVVRRSRTSPRWQPLGGPAMIAGRMVAVGTIEGTTRMTEIPAGKHKARKFVAWRDLPWKYRKGDRARIERAIREALVAMGKPSDSLYTTNLRQRVLWTDSMVADIADTVVGALDVTP